MCLAIPGKILTIQETDEDIFRSGRVSFGGIIKEVNLSMVPEASSGDFVLVHVGIALNVIDEEEAQKTLEYLRQIGEFDELKPDSLQ